MATASMMTSTAMPTPTATQTLSDSALAASLLSATMPDCDTDNSGGVDISGADINTFTVSRYKPLFRPDHDGSVLGDTGGG